MTLISFLAISAAAMLPNVGNKSFERMRSVSLMLRLWLPTSKYVFTSWHTVKGILFNLQLFSLVIGFFTFD